MKKTVLFVIFLLAVAFTSNAWACGGMAGSDPDGDGDSAKVVSESKA